MARKVLLRYGHLGILWKSRGSVHARTKTLNATVNEVWRDCGLPADHTNESQYWALVCEREWRQSPGPDVDSNSIEGSSRLVNHLRRERNPRLAEREKRKVLNDAGKLLCEACEFNFAERYPGLGTNSVKFTTPDLFKKVRGSRNCQNWLFSARIVIE
jgi:hypothetical protein